MLGSVGTYHVAPISKLLIWFNVEGVQLSINTPENQAALEELGYTNKNGDYGSITGVFQKKVGPDGLFIIDSDDSVLKRGELEEDLSLIRRKKALEFAKDHYKKEGVDGEGVALDLDDVRDYTIIIDEENGEENLFDRISQKLAEDGVDLSEREFLEAIMSARCNTSSVVFPCHGSLYNINVLKQVEPISSGTDKLSCTFHEPIELNLRDKFDVYRIRALGKGLSIIFESQYLGYGDKCNFDSFIDNRKNLMDCLKDLFEGFSYGDRRTGLNSLFPDEPGDVHERSVKYLVNYILGKGFEDKSVLKEGNSLLNNVLWGRGNTLNFRKPEDAPAFYQGLKEIFDVLERLVINGGEPISDVIPELFGKVKPILELYGNETDSSIQLKDD